MTREELVGLFVNLIKDSEGEVKASATAQATGTCIALSFTNIFHSYSLISLQ